MSFLTDASLVFIPSGYKEDKAYSIKPTDGSGDLTFARASDGTRVNSEGYVERVPWNLLQYSNTFSNGAWTKLRSNVVSGQTDKDGGTNAWKFNDSTDTATHRLDFVLTLTDNVPYTFSCYAKAGEHNTLGVEVGNNGVAANYVLFHLNNGTKTEVGTITSSSITSVGNGWYYCVVTQNAGAIDRFCTQVQTDSTGSYTGTGTDGIYIQDAQLNEGTLKPYFPTTDRLNVPRLDYSNGCPCLLLEPQRTNLLTYSEQFSNAAWTKLGAGTGSVPVLTSNYGTSPSGRQDSTRLQLDLNGGTGTYTNQSLIYQVPSGSSATYTNSIYIKGASGQKVYFAKDLSNFELVTTDGTWQRVDYSYTSTPSLAVGTRGTTGSSDELDIEIWGAQLEAGSYPTSYIPTTSASVTRVADAASKTGISDLIGQTEGTLFADFVFDGLGTEQRLGISDGTSANYNNIRITTGGTLYVLGAASSVLQYEINCASLSIGNRYKVALAYKQNDIIVYLNGSNVGSDNSATIGACSRFGFDNRDATSVPFRSPINQAVLFKTRLTNDQLEYLTGTSYSTYATMASQLNYTIQ